MQEPSPIDLPLTNQSMSETTNKPKHPRQSQYEFLCGCIGGFTQVIIGQPFDIVKVRLQTQTAENKMYNSMMDCVTKIWKLEGPAAFYKGTLPPLMGVGACVAIQFGILETCKRFFQSLQSSSKELDLKYVMMSGSVAGFANASIAIPAEHLRIRMQIQKSDGVTALQYRSSMDCARQIYRAHGIQGIFKGTNITLMRESLSVGLYFLTYEAVLRRLLKPGQERSELGAAKLMGAGALAGYAFWIVGFPLDLLKTKIQTDNLSNPTYKSIIQCAKRTHEQGGIAGFYRGMLPCILRAGPVNAGCFLAYETMLTYLTQNH